MSIFVDQATVFCGGKDFCFIKDSMESLKELSRRGYSFFFSGVPGFYVPA